jgi:hypothetical protein
MQVRRLPPHHHRWLSWPTMHSLPREICADGQAAERWQQRRFGRQYERIPARLDSHDAQAVEKSRAAD